MEKKANNTPMISCLKATELIEKKIFIKLSLTEQVQLRLHKAICSGCRAYAKQSVLLNKLLKNHISGTNVGSVPQFINNGLKQQIILKLKA